MIRTTIVVFFSLCGIIFLFYVWPGWVFDAPVAIQGVMESKAFCESNGFSEVKGTGSFESLRCCRINEVGFKECEPISCDYNYKSGHWVCERYLRGGSE